ncbi:type 2 lanthipeptide synthetase LanM family protein [Nostoc punctiforme]|uniref:Glutathione S-transferase LANCL1 n=1 Tax=Nostoc punctiforme (strain ATCC 29133 / PCC 73102) TaxID=63737 RepID=B2IZX9_NOSP7|nr:type 2 lanthipeptide synthetase LanM family protein [Nostoc punctiforme]ACC81750.1 Lanthionine synthetase C family protein [Nostoc punctiforme PCC 73102]
MKNLAITQQLVPSQQITPHDLAIIVANASFLGERLQTEQFVMDGDRIHEQEINHRIDRWGQVVAQGSWDMLHKRLQWDGLELDSIRPRLGSVRLAKQLLPDWAETLGQIIQTAKEFIPVREAFLPIESQNSIPFEDLLLPAIQVAREQLLSRLGFVQLTHDSLPLSIFTEAAYRSLERSLLQQLARLCSKTLDLEFSQVRSFGRNLLNLLELKTKSGNNTQYTKFVNQLLQDGLLTFFQKYPVLGRLVATTVNFWVESTGEFIERLAHDTKDIQQIFGSTSAKDKVAAVQTSLSDPHKRGRGVILLTFESGLKLVYKPKDLKLEAAFNNFLTWCNHHSQLLDFKAIQVINRDDYGWVEYVEHQPCVDEAAAARFYQRAGMLLCVIYVLRGTDCHYENLIASGEHLVLLDMETLLHHEAKAIENSPDAQEWETIAMQQFWNSVLRTGFLPRWDLSSDRTVAYDISGLGSTALQQSPRKVPRWQLINTDDMYLRYESVTLPIEKNVPRIGDTVLSPHDYQAQIVAGFEQMYRFLMAHKQVLLAPNSPLGVMQKQQVRFIFRHTRLYGTILQKVLTPDYLKCGVDYSIELEQLSRAFLVAQEKPNAWPIFNAEVQAMEQLDIPYFSASAASDELCVGEHLSIPGYFKQPSYQQTLAQLLAMDETDLARQVAIIQGSFYAQLAQTSTGEHEKWQAESLPLLTTEQLIAEAQAIATQLETRAIMDFDGSINWIGLVSVPEAERFRLQVLDHSFYEGRCGIALFFAALAQITDDPRSYELALKSLQPLRQQIQTLDLESRQRMASFAGIGGATGLGSMIYALVKISQFLGDETLLQDAQALASWITSELIAGDKKLDIIGGSAGAILGLLSLYQATGNENILLKAIACGQHLLAYRYSETGATRAWQTLGKIPLAGFSHGAAGIAYALLRLYTVTQDQSYLAAAQEGIEYERTVFSESRGNWPVSHKAERTGGKVTFPSQWCHGAAGIGLARLGSLEILNTAEIQQEIEIALRTTENFGLEAIDHLCCGNMGRVEVLLVGAQRCDRSDWHQIALQNATNVVARANRTGAYQLFANLPSSVFNPGLFQGTAGIGYELLRLANNDLPCVLLWE